MEFDMLIIEPLKCLAFFLSLKRQARRFPAVSSLYAMLNYPSADQHYDLYGEIKPVSVLSSDSLTL